jgi:hypothetical protein
MAWRTQLELLQASRGVPVGQDSGGEAAELDFKLRNSSSPCADRRLPGCARTRKYEATILDLSNVAVHGGPRGTASAAAGAEDSDRTRGFVFIIIFAERIVVNFD